MFKSFNFEETFFDARGARPSDGRMNGNAVPREQQSHRKKKSAPLQCASEHVPILRL
jgi:hypothetical protein